MRRLIWLFPVLFTGCATLSERSKDIESYGETAKSAGEAIVAFNPEIGLLLVVGGGLAMIVGKLLKRKKGSE